MPIDPKWRAKYQRPDVTFTRESANVIRTLRAKYATDYQLFFRKMMQVYAPKGKTYAELQGGLYLTAKIIRGFDAMLGTTGRPATDAEIDTLFQNVEELELQMQYFQRMYAKSVKFRREAKKLEAMSGVNLSNMAGVSGMVDQELRELGLQGEKPQDFLKKHAPELYEMGTGVGRFALQSMLGPFYEMGTMAWRGVTGIAGGLRGRQIARRRTELGRRFSPLGMDLGEDMMGGMGRGRTAGGGRGIKDIFGMAGLGGGMTSKAGDIGGATVAGMAGFFDTEAYRSRWTKEVLQLLKNMSGGPGGGTGWLSQLGKLVPVLEIVAVALAGIGGWMLGRKIDEGIRKTVGDKAYDNFWLSMATGGRQGEGIPKTLASMMLPQMGPSAEKTLLTKKSFDIMRSKGMDVTQYFSKDQIAIYDAMNKIGNAVQSGLKAVTDTFQKAFPGQGTMPTTGSTQAMYRPDDPLTDNLNRTDEETA